MVTTDGWVLAIDYGTTATAAAVRESDGTVHSLTLADDEPTMPSSVFAEEGGHLVAGREADNQAAYQIDCYDPTPKRRVGRTGPPIPLGDHDGEPAALIAAVYTEILREAVIQQHNGIGPAAVVLTHPASWRASRREVLAEALTRAAAEVGVMLPDPLFMSEPEAAAHWYVRQSDPPEVGQCIAVYDLGGGTFDAAVLRRTEAGFEPVADGAIDHLGGYDFDNLLFAYLGETYIAPSDPELWADLSGPGREHPGEQIRMRAQVREIKRQLSSQTSRPFRVPGTGEQKLISLAEYEALITDKVQQTVAEFERTLASAGLDAGHLAAVYRIGGAARTPLVKLALQQYTPRTEEHPKLVVAQGGALAADISAAATPTPAPLPPPVVYEPPPDNHLVSTYPPDAISQVAQWITSYCQPDVTAKLIRGVQQAIGANGLNAQLLIGGGSSTTGHAYLAMTWTHRLHFFEADEFTGSTQVKCIGKTSFRDPVPSVFEHAAQLSDLMVDADGLATYRPINCAVTIRQRRSFPVGAVLRLVFIQFGRVEIRTTPVGAVWSTGEDGESVLRFTVDRVKVNPLDGTTVPVLATLCDRQGRVIRVFYSISNTVSTVVHLGQSS